MRLCSFNLCSALLAVCSCRVFSEKNDQNFLIILADDLGYGDLSCYGHPTSITPNLDQLANEGMRFTQFYSASPVCSPSRSSIVTGRLPARNGVYCANSTKPCANPTDKGCCNGVFLPGMPGGLPQSEVSFATALKESNDWNGTTGMIGKWHLGTEEKYFPTTGHGFDYYYGVPHGLGACPCHACFAPNQTCSIKCQPNWAPCPVFENRDIVQQPANLITLSDDYVRAAKRFIQSAVEDKKQPFLLYFASHHTHSPQFAGFDTTNVTARGRFGDSLAELDRSVGSLLSFLKEYEVDSNTLVIFTSDNGPSLRNEIRGGNAGLLKCGKGTTYEGGMRVPAIFRWPGVIQPGTVQRSIASALDIFPTIINIANRKPAVPSEGQTVVKSIFHYSHKDLNGRTVRKKITLDGYDMIELLRENDPRSGCTGPRQGKLVYYPQFAMQSRGLYAVRTNRTKVHFHTEGSLQSNPDNSDIDCRPSSKYSTPVPPHVYDLGVDPSENYLIEPSSEPFSHAIENAKRVREEHLKHLKWFGWPMLNNGTFDRKLWPCAKPGCSPFPQCCVIDPDIVNVTEKEGRFAIQESS
jgi:arylsulfatase A|eukprot:Stramenopile-MAST_4_protein_3092